MSEKSKITRDLEGLGTIISEFSQSSEWSGHVAKLKVDGKPDMGVERTLLEFGNAFTGYLRSQDTEDFSEVELSAVLGVHDSLNTLFMTSREGKGIVDFIVEHMLANEDAAGVIIERAKDRMTVDMVSAPQIGGME